MRTSFAILTAGILVALSTVAILWTTRYEVAQPFDPKLFHRYDRWTGRIETCSSYFDERTYCGFALGQRADQAVQADNERAMQTLRNWGYSENEIKSWPKHVFEEVRNGVLNGDDKSAIENWLKMSHVQ
jgi:hypothetical protein